MLYEWSLVFFWGGVHLLKFFSGPLQIIIIIIIITCKLVCFYQFVLYTFYLRQSLEYSSS